MDLQAGLSRTPCACKKLKPERRVSRSLPYTLRAEPIQAPIWELEGGRPLFRFWHDEKRFKGDGQSSIAQRTLLQLGGQRTGGNAKHDPSNGRMGWEVPDEWDVLWSPSTTAQRALTEPPQPLAAHHCVNAIPGSRALTRKKLLSSTLRAAYGHDAFSLVMPTTFGIPSQMREWVDYLKQHKAQDEVPDPLACGPKSLWVLKTAENLGKGVRIVEQRYALKEFLERAQRHMDSEDKRQVRQFLTIQRYVANPLLIGGCKFGLRVWAALTIVDPLRIYLHSQGLVLFSSKEYDEGSIEDQQGHLTNYAQNVDGKVWTLGMLKEHLGPQNYERIMEEVKKRTALAFAAAAGKLRAAPAARDQVCTSYELFGLDFLVDVGLTPWLLEVNATPSLAVEHQDIAVEKTIHHAKASMIADLFSLVRVPARYVDQLKEEDDWLSAAAAELQYRAGFEPLMHLLPSPENQKPGWDISWSPRDEHLRSWMEQNSALTKPKKNAIHGLPAIVRASVEHVPSRLHQNL